MERIILFLCQYQGAIFHLEHIEFYVTLSNTCYTNA